MNSNTEQLLNRILELCDSSGNDGGESLYEIDAAIRTYMATPSTPDSVEEEGTPCCTGICTGLCERIGGTLYKILGHNHEKLDYVKSATPSVDILKALIDKARMYNDGWVESQDELIDWFFSQRQFPPVSAENAAREYVAISQLTISKILVDNKYRFPVNENDKAVFLVDIPVASKILFELFSAALQTPSPAREYKTAEQWFDNNSDCYTQVDKGDGSLTEEPAITKEMFLEYALQHHPVVQHTGGEDTNTSSPVKK